MFEILVDVFSPLLVTIIGGVIIAILIYIGSALKKMVDIIDCISSRQDKTDRILYGEGGVSDGLVKMIVESKRDIERLRLVQMELINKLRKEDIIDYDSEIKEICHKLNESNQ